jgi:hypothetical protein
MFVEGMCSVVNLMGGQWYSLHTGPLGNIQFQVVDWFTITVLPFNRDLNLNCIILTVK